jgi:DNA-binding IclR family transcriptional regulator
METALTRLQSTILELVKTRPGIRPGELSKMTGRDRNQLRRAALALADKGLVEARQDDEGFLLGTSFLSATGTSMMRGPAASRARIMARSFLQSKL